MKDSNESEPAKPTGAITIPKNFKATIKVNNSNSSLLRKNSKQANAPTGMSLEYHSKSTIDISL